jgi:2Fe-2S ferredoxin
MGKVTFTFENSADVITCDIEEGESILEVALDNDIHLSHNCGAVCACSTCHIYLEQGEDLVQEISDKEEDFIDRARNPKINSRLACQCVLEGEGDLLVKIPDQSSIIGH